MYILYSTIQKFGISQIFLKALIFLLIVDALNLSTLTVKLKIDAALLNFLSIEVSWKHNKTKQKHYYGFHKNIKQHSCFQHC